MGKKVSLTLFYQKGCIKPLSQIPTSTQQALLAVKSQEAKSKVLNIIKLLTIIKGDSQERHVRLFALKLELLQISPFLAQRLVVL